MSHYISLWPVELLGPWCDATSYNMITCCTLWSIRRCHTTWHYDQLYSSVHGVLPAILFSLSDVTLHYTMTSCTPQSMVYYLLYSLVHQKMSHYMTLWPVVLLSPWCITCCTLWSIRRCHTTWHYDQLYSSVHGVLPAVLFGPSHDVQRQRVDTLGQSLLCSTERKHFSCVQVSNCHLLQDFLWQEIYVVTMDWERHILLS